MMCNRIDQNIHLYLLKYSFNEISHILINIINFSLELGKEPDKMKTSTIIPTRKISNTCKVEEFRHINMLASLEKILQKVVYLQLEQYINDNNILKIYQSCFRGYSYATALQYTINEWKETLDENRIAIIFFMDLKRALQFLA